MAVLVRLDNIISIPVHVFTFSNRAFHLRGHKYIWIFPISRYHKLYALLILKRLNSLVYKVPFPLTDLSLLNTSSFKLGSDYVLHNRIILLYGICVVKHTCQWSPQSLINQLFVFLFLNSVIYTVCTCSKWRPVG